jgi:hypothetical protein
MDVSQKTRTFIQKARQKRGNKYDYTKVQYEKSVLKVTIICPIHGEFEQKAGGHLSGKGCMACGIKTRSQKHTRTNEQFIERAKQIHVDKYDSLSCSWGI